MRLPTSGKTQKKKSQQSDPDTGSDKSKNTSIFSPLHGNEDNLRLESKFRILEEEEDDDEKEKQAKKWAVTNKKPLDKPSATTSVPKRARREVVAVGGKERQVKKATSNREEVSTSRSISAKSRAVTADEQSSDSETDGDGPTKGNDRSPMHGGFNDEDLEKPRLEILPIGPKEPFLLSDKDERPIIQVPATINQYLRDYQREGIQFLHKHYHEGSGSILGDDMGLGKTVQVIGFLSAVLGKTGTKTDVMKQKPRFIRELSDDAKAYEDNIEPKKTFLIIGPASVLYNWVDELETWGHFTVGRYHKNHKQQTVADLKKKKLDIVLTTFETCRDNIEELNSFTWTAVIADEVHRIKGMKAETTQALKTLHCKRRYGLSGTSLDWANPGCLGGLKQFQFHFESKIERGQLHDASKRELADARKAKEKFAELRSKWMLRRMKSIIAQQLPNKVERVVYCRPSDFQVSVYKAMAQLGHLGHTTSLL